ncbi:hypothetical protein HDZ31DRAFT_84914 [Schizophyllum fasciatum]
MNRLPALASDEARLPPLPACVGTSASRWHCGWPVDEAWINFVLQRAREDPARAAAATPMRARLQTAAAYLSMAADCDVRGVFVARRTGAAHAHGQPFLVLCSTQPAPAFLRRPTVDQLGELERVLGYELGGRLLWEEGLPGQEGEEDEVIEMRPSVRCACSSGSEASAVSGGEKPKRWASVRRKLTLTRKSTDNEACSPKDC